jgi:tryptophan synthase alpha chain
LGGSRGGVGSEATVGPATSALERTFADLRAARRAAFIPYITAGDPDLDGTVELAEVLARAGADIIEIGIPFSDPLADGPTIQRSSERALAHGVSLRQVIERLPEIRERASVPIVLMSYLNPILQLGLARFARAARGGGADGVIVTDLPVEEARDVLAACDREGLDLITLAAPTSGAARLEKIARAARGFVYCVTRAGVTGARAQLPADLRALVGAVRAATQKPVAVGFGISSAEHVRAAARFADGVVVGSAIVDRIGRLGSERAPMLEEVGRFAGELAAALRKGPA